MRRQTTLFFACFLMLCGLSFAAQHQYSTGKIIDVQQKSREKVDMYLVNTPITSAVPYFEITVRLGNTDFVAEHNQRHADEELPSDWVSGAEVNVRLERHHLFLKRADGSEVEWLVVKRIHVSENPK